jgi:hypothetical protein
MRGGARSSETRHAVPTSLARGSESLPEAAQICDDGFNTSAHWALIAWGRNGVEGRIAVCPRLQQIGQIT